VNYLDLVRDLDQLAHGPLRICVLVLIAYFMLLPDLLSLHRAPRAAGAHDQVD